MREQFPWYIDPTEDDLQRLWDEGVFSFDANVLLNLYRVDKETTEDYFKIFRALGDRIFLPHEAANQFFQNRRGVIRTEQNSFSEAKQRVRNWVERRTGFDDIKQQLSGDVGKIIEDEIKTVFENRGDYEKEVEEVKDDLVARIKDLEERFTPTGTTRANAEEDEILDGLMEIFEWKTGSELDDDIEDLKDEAQERYKEKQPPGYLDYNEDDENISRGECEDFLIWKQLMELAEREGEDVVFITGEKKPDWWKLDEEYEPLRPRHELLREFRRKTGRAFWILTTERLVDNADDRLETKVKRKSKEQTRIIQIKRSSYEKQIMKKLEKIKVYKNTIDNLKNMIGGEFTKSAKRKIDNKLSLVDTVIKDIKEKSDMIGKNEREVVSGNIKEVRRSIESGKINNIIKYTEKLVGSLEALVEVAENEVQSD